MKISPVVFPQSLKEPFVVTSLEDTRYNCIAWAFGDNSKWYWPDEYMMAFWPASIPRSETVDAFIELFRSIGYEICENGDHESLTEKVAIYVDEKGKPTHAARQLATGEWTSKLGKSNDVSHSIYSMENGCYGNIGVFMSRDTQTTVPG
ncbi:MAG: hypothetical protein AAF901_09425 [Bacteroidota bacterium]